ncbi:MAG: TfoX/Sxy family DNA transformation protein [Planctomycetes bacterium]|nr:TfoX/Sxy family DNA transformation protein [Planctomycetota bacterium]
MDVGGELAERLDALGAVAVRRMFGGQGLFLDGRMFGLVAQGTPYFKVDDETRADYERAGAEPFTYGRSKEELKPTQLGYYEVPATVLERDRDLLEWARRAVLVAERAAAKKPKQKSSRPRTLRGMRGLGPKSVEWLRDAGVETPAQLEQLGSVGAFLRVRSQQPKVSLNLLYALEGALLDVHWAKLPADLKRRLQAAVKSR